MRFECLGKENMEIKCFRIMCGVTIRHRNINKENRRRVGVQINTSERVPRCFLSWFCHLEQENDERIA